MLSIAFMLIGLSIIGLLALLYIVTHHPEKLEMEFNSITPVPKQKGNSIEKSPEDDAGITAAAPQQSFTQTLAK